MNKFQELIIKQNQKVRSNRLQILILYAEFLYTCVCLLNAMSIFERKNNTNKLKLEFIYYVTLPSFVEFLNISQIVIQTITIFFSLICIIIIIFEDNLKGMAKFAEIMWDSYPNFIQVVIIQNSAYCLLLDEVNFLLSIFNIFIALLTSQFMSIYTFQQNETQILLRSFLERSLIPLCYSVISIFAGLMLHNIYALYAFLASILLFDLYFGVFYYIKPHMQFLCLDVNKLIVKFSFQRITVAGFLFYFSGLSLILSCIFTVPLMMKIHDSLWNQRFIQFIYQTNMYFQYICIDKFRANDKMIESYFEYFAALRGFTKPFNRVLMLSLFCNHMNKCQNLKCFCQNKNFYENVKVTSQLAIDLKSIQQQVNFAIGELDIIQCYQQLLLIFIDNYVNNTKYTIIGETLIVKQSLFEINYFKNRLFQTKLKMQFLKISYPFFHPIRIQRVATSKLITDQLLQFVGQNSNVQLDISSTLNYFKLIEDITIQLKIIIEEKIQIFQFIKRNYQSPLPYQLNIITQKFFSKLDSLEQQIQQAAQINGFSYTIRELQDEFYGQVKIDYQDKHKHQKTQIQFVNNNLTAFIICDFEGELLIKQYSNNLLDMINTSSQIKGSPIETIVPGILQAYHRVAVSQMIQTGETKLVNKNQYSLKVKSNKYVLEVDALLKYDYRNLNLLRFIGFMQIHDKDCMIILSDEKGKIDSASRSASALLKLDEIDLTTLNYFQLSPNLLQEENSHEFDGFILIPKYNRQKQETLQLYRYYISRPNDCEIFLVNAKSEKTQYSQIVIYCLKINSFYQLKEDDFKIIALDLMIKQFMIQKKLSKSQYFLTQESIKRIENFKKTLKINKISSNQSYDEDYNLEINDDSERQIQVLDQNKSNLPEFIPSLDSIRTQQEKLLITVEKCKEVYQSVQLKDKSFENYKKYDSTEIIRQEQESVRNYQNTHQVIEIELNAQEDQNIEDQLQLILSNVKKSTTRKEQLEMKNQIRNKIKASTWQGSGRQHASKKLIRNIVSQFIKSKITYLTQIKLISCLITMTNIGFILGFTINCIFDLAGVQMDSNNQTYPLNLLQDINLIMLGIQIQDYNSSYYNLSSQLIITGSSQYKNLSIYVNDEQHDYHTFLQELDEETIKARERGIKLLYKKKYFLKNYMVEKIKTIEEKPNISVFDNDAEFLFDNFPTLATELWNLKNMTTSDVKERIDQLNYMSQILLIFSVTINCFLVTIFLIIFMLIIKWRNKLYSTFFLFSNLSQSISSLQESIRQLNEYENKYKKIEDENKNKKARLFEKLYGITILIILLLISLGFYIPLFIYINSVNNESIDVNQLQTEVTIMQLKQSIILNWYTINQTSVKYNKTFIHNGSVILSELIDQCSESEIFVLYKLPYDSKYDFFPEIQEYASFPLCNCSLIDFQLQNGYQGFHAFVNQHLQEQQKYYEIMQAYQIVFDYQISKKTQFDEYMQIRLRSSQYTLQVILVIIVALILLTNIFMFFLVLQRLDKLILSAKNIVHLFPTQLIANNKYTLQLLIQSSTNN